MNASQEFFVTLADLCKKGETGSIFGVTTTDRLLVVALVKGQIQGLRYGGRTGRQVIALLETVDIQRFSIKPDKLQPVQDDLPATADILNALSLRIPLDSLDLLAMALSSTPDTDAPTAVDDAAAGVSSASLAEPKVSQLAEPKARRQLMYRG